MGVRLKECISHHPPLVPPLVLSHTLTHALAVLVNLCTCMGTKAILSFYAILWSKMGCMVLTRPQAHFRYSAVEEKDLNNQKTPC